MYSSLVWYHMYCKWSVHSSLERRNVAFVYDWNFATLPVVITVHSFSVTGVTCCLCWLHICNARLDRSLTSQTSTWKDSEKYFQWLGIDLHSSLVSVTNAPGDWYVRDLSEFGSAYHLNGFFGQMELYFFSISPENGTNLAVSFDSKFRMQVFSRSINLKSSNHESKSKTQVPTAKT